jgi:class 3 adenylate cyclase
MHKSTQSRWIEQAEARAVLERAALHRAASEPHVESTYASAGPNGFDRLRDLSRVLRRLVAAIRRRPDDTMVRTNSHMRAALRLPSAELDEDRILVAVLITDIVDSTKQVAEIGDRAWRVLLDQHNRVTRSQIKRFGGKEVANRGDGFVGIFNSPTRAVRCAAAIGDTLAPLGILLRCGVHAGEVHLNRDEISGLTAHITARIAAAARPGEAAVSKLVRDLAAGSELVFEDRGVHDLRGLPEQMHLYAMPGVAAPVTTNVIGLRTT